MKEEHDNSALQPKRQYLAFDYSSELAGLLNEAARLARCNSGSYLASPSDRRRVGKLLDKLIASIERHSIPTNLELIRAIDTENMDVAFIDVECSLPISVLASYINKAIKSWEDIYLAEKAERVHPLGCFCDFCQ